jgi:FKBP-type peptidyl-prolyl cis-trans isomerase
MTETTTASGLRYMDIETGTGETATGADQTVLVQHTGRLAIPPEPGYGSRGAGGVIPQDARLVFEIERLEISI